MAEESAQRKLQSYLAARSAKLSAAEIRARLEAMLFAEPVLQALAWPAVLVANLLAAGVMGGYFRLRHPALSVRP